MTRQARHAANATSQQQWQHSRAAAVFQGGGGSFPATRQAKVQPWDHNTHVSSSSAACHSKAMAVVVATMASLGTKVSKARR